ncbi:MAG: hypothetical protein P1V13_13690 [Rhizobiaceae bacterium]|nr:hypothetical protein [Rhizobiaceae bacterium]|tara:strand:+ start:563 stop:859 length:297 start_codon:yes stop_codon:yes gene_type:complete
MHVSKDISEINQRVKAIETQLAERYRKIAGTGTPPSDLSDKTDAIRSKSSALKQKLTEKQDSVWGDVKDELHRDLHALEGDFDHWVKYLDEHFQNPGA